MPHPSEKRYAAQGRPGNERRHDGRDENEGRSRTGSRRRDRTGDGDSPAELSPVLDIARYDERHHYGRHSIERRQERQAERRRNNERAIDEESRPGERRHGRFGSQF